MDAAFIDRDNPKAAVESLKKVEELARKGLSILIAPEGTRLDTTEVGPFKKGPFRIAMSAGIPIVPIVIRNAEVISARDSTTFNPGTVDVVVYPPIPTDDWTVQNLPDRIAEVRQLYLDTLKDWPHEKVPKLGPYAASEEHSARRPRPRRHRRRPRRRRRLRRRLPRRRRRRRRPGEEGTARRRRPGRRRDGRDRRRPNGQLLHHRRRAGAGLGVVARRTRAVERLAATASGVSIPTPRSTCSSCPTATRRLAVLARLVEELEADEDRTRRPGAGLLGARRPAHPLEGGRADFRPRHLPAAGDPATPHSQARPVARAGGRGRTREGVRAAPAVERHHRRREPTRFRAFRDPARDAWPSNASSCGCSGRNTSHRS